MRLERLMKASMQEHTVRFEISGPDAISMPEELLNRGGFYQVQVRDGDVFIAGNRDGLLYLAEALIRCAKGNLVKGFHVHVPLDSAERELKPSTTRDELVLFAASDDRL